MPIFRFTCQNCQKEITKLAKASLTTLACECGSDMQKQLPTEISSLTMELRDAHRGVQLPKNQERKVKDRYQKNHDRYDLAEKIDKHGLEDADKFKWTEKIKKT